MDVNQYLEIFIEESKENLQNMNQNLLQLENDQQNMDLIHEIFRIAHTLKGMSATMGFHKVAKLTHEMENVLQSLRSKEILMSEKIIDILFECLDILEAYIDTIVNTGQEGEQDSQHLIDKLHKVIIVEDVDLCKDEIKDIVVADEEIDIKVEEFSKNIILKSIQQGYAAYRVRVELNSGCMLKAARAFIVFNMIEQDSEIIKSNPPVEDIEDEKFDTIFELIILSKIDKEIIKNKLMNISEIEKVSISNIEEKEITNSPEAIEEIQQKEDTNNIEIDAKKEDEKKDTQTQKKPKLGKTVRVDIDRLDNLMNLVSELIITRSRLEEIDESGKKQNMNEAIEYLERITTSLHDAVMKVRMVPIERVFNRFPRMIRDLSKDLGKEISLLMSGEETEVDRTVIDEIGDPLIHLIRNSIDHGIEEPNIREQHGKPEMGTVKLIAYPDGNSVVIEVEDDGEGIDIERVKAKAIKNELITKEQANTMDDNDAVMLLFKSGFSTAEVISDISGRGVGLDVVKTKIESLGGIVEVQTSRWVGSKFIIRLPLTLAIIQALLVNVGTEKYAIPLNSIKEIITIKSNEIRKIQEQEVILYRNTTLPLLRMNKILQVNQQKEEQEDLTVVVAKKGEKSAGFIVDGLIGQQEIVIKTLGKFLSEVKVIAGATILGNGQVALIVDINSLF
ncbi:chemotaxis protein CheA [Lutibacter sp. B2]|nr:chemotaxis protein CheA [Lutibacter sp. B2]